MATDETMLLMAITLLVMTGLGTLFTLQRVKKQRRARKERIEELAAQTKNLAARIDKLGGKGQGFSKEGLKEIKKLKALLAKAKKEIKES